MRPQPSPGMPPRAPEPRPTMEPTQTSDVGEMLARTYGSLSLLLKDYYCNRF